MAPHDYVEAEESRKRAGERADARALVRRTTKASGVPEHVEDGAGAFLAVGLDLDRVLTGPGDGGADAAEVEAGPDLLGGLVQRVVDFLTIDLRHDVERGF